MAITLDDTEPPRQAGNVSTWTPIEVLAGELVRDPSLQCRAAMNPAKIDEYAEAYADGASMPPLRAVRVDGRLFLVDGWHRLAAWERTKGTTNRRIVVEVRDGSRRDALLEAVRANPHHGLPRSSDDKRRAVRTLLMDAEWCRMSSRELADLAAVSHAFVSGVRRAYGVDAGQVLTGDVVERVDGEATGPWAELLAAAPTWQRNEVEQMRKAPTVRALAARQYSKFDEHVRKAFELRASELAAGDWPGLWADDPEKRVASLDTVEDLEMALGAKGCPRLMETYEVLRQALDLDNRTWQLEHLVEAWQHRPRLLARAQARLEKVTQEREAQQAKDPYYVARRIEGLFGKYGAQQDAVEVASKKALSMVDPKKVMPGIRDGIYRKKVAPEAFTCFDPTCGGWLRPTHYSQIGVCVVCNADGSEWKRTTHQAATTAAKLLRHPDYGMRVGDVTLDKPSLDLLGALERARAEGKLGTFVRSAPVDVREVLQLWVKANRPKVLIDPEADDADEKAESPAVQKLLQQLEALANEDDEKRCELIEACNDAAALQRLWELCDEGGLELSDVVSGLIADRAELLEGCTCDEDDCDEDCITCSGHELCVLAMATPAGAGEQP
jgi:hypothetical protein